MMHKIDKLMLYLTLAFPVIIIIVVVAMVWPKTALIVHSYEIYNDISPLQNRTMKSYDIRAGEDMEFDISFTKKIDVICEVTVLLKQQGNGYLYPYEIVPKYITRMPTGSHHYKNSTPIPRATPDGKYIFVRSYSCEINPLNTFKLSVESNPFFVVGKTKSQVELMEEGNRQSVINTQKLEKLEKKVGMK